MMGRMIRALAHVATMGTRPGEIRWTIEVVCGLASVVVGSFALMLSIWLVFGGLAACVSEPYRTFGELIGVGYEIGLWLGAFTCPLPILLCLLAQVVPWANFRQRTDTVLLPIERAKVRFMMLAFLPVVPFATITCGSLAAMNVRDPGCDILVPSTVPGWTNSQVLELVVFVSLVFGVAVFVWTVVHGMRRVGVLVEPDEGKCSQCGCCIVGLDRCPECGLKRTAQSVEE